MRRALFMVWVFATVVALSIAPAIGVLVGIGYAHPKLYQHTGREFHALRFDGPRIQYWHGEYFAAEGVTDGERYHYREVQPDWAEQHAPSKVRTRLPTGSFLPFDDDSRMGFSRHPWWPPIAAPITAQTYGPRDLPGADGQLHSVRIGPTLTVHTAMSWFVLAVASIPWPIVIVAVVVRRVRPTRRRSAGRCGRCGYDLRASPARCPECGAAPLRLSAAAGLHA